MARIAGAGWMVIAATAAGCAELPAAPTYLDNVRPLLLANCVRCHAAPTACTAADRRGYRLDHWSNVGADRGVAALTERITIRAVDAATMPPNRGLADREREVLRRWQRAGSPRGEHPDDTPPPTLTLASAVPTAEPADQRVALAYDVRDPDGDTVLWSIAWRRAGVDGALAEHLADGRGQLELDLGVLASGTYQLVATLDDDVAAAPGGGRGRRADRDPRPRRGAERAPRLPRRRRAAGADQHGRGPVDRRQHRHRRPADRHDRAGRRHRPGPGRWPMGSTPGPAATRGRRATPPPAPTGSRSGSATAPPRAAASPPAT